MVTLTIDGRTVTVPMKKRATDGDRVRFVGEYVDQAYLDLLAEDETLTPEQREQVEAILRGTEQTRTYLLKIRAQVQTPLKYKRP